MHNPYRSKALNYCFLIWLWTRIIGDRHFYDSQSNPYTIGAKLISSISNRNVHCSLPINVSNSSCYAARPSQLLLRIEYLNFDFDSNFPWHYFSKVHNLEDLEALHSDNATKHSNPIYIHIDPNYLLQFSQVQD